MRHTEYTANQALAIAAARKPAPTMPTAAESARHAARQHCKPAPRPMPEWLHAAIALVSFAAIGAMLAL